MITEIITRRKNIQGKKFWFSANSKKRDYESALVGLWSNTLYIHFVKEDFPQLVYPKVKPVTEVSWYNGFDYYHCDVAELPWHGGITFYEEKFDVASGKTLVKAGCDYQHLHDEHWQTADNGKTILETDAVEIEKAFEAMIGG